MLGEMAPQFLGLFLMFAVAIFVIWGIAYALTCSPTDPAHGIMGVIMMLFLTPFLIKGAILTYGFVQIMAWGNGTLGLILTILITYSIIWLFVKPCREAWNKRHEGGI